MDERINEILAQLQHEIELLRDNKLTEKIQALISEIEKLVNFIKSLDPENINKRFNEVEKKLTEQTENLISVQKKNLILNYSIIVLLISIILIFFFK